MGDTVDPITILQAGGPGTAMHRVTHFPGAPRPELIWILRAESRQIRELPDQPVIGIRAGLMVVDHVSLVPVVICLDSSERDEAFFETWINANQQGENPLTLLAGQNRIIIQFYGDSLKLEKSIAVPNSLRQFAATLLSAVDETSDQWTLRQFEEAKEKMYERYPNVRSLWQSLAPVVV